MILVIEYDEFPDGICCIPITKDDDKNKKWFKLSKDKPDLVHKIEVNEYDSYLLIQNMYILHKSFIGREYTLNNIPFEIKNTKIQKDIIQKVNKVDLLLNKKILNYVPRKEVFEIQLKYLEEKNLKK